MSFNDRNLARNEQIMLMKIFWAQGTWVAAHLRTFFKECGSFVHTIFPGKCIHLRTQFPQVNVTFAHIRFSKVNGMFAFGRLYRQAKPSFQVQALSLLDTWYSRYSL